jgi:CHAD domain-containing protein
MALMSSGPPDTFTLSWHKKSAESFAHILRRIAERASSLSSDKRFSAEQVIHEVRLLIKRVRALLWFARPSVARTIEAEARTQLRKASELLAGQRDIKAAQTTFEKMLEEIDSTTGRQALEKTSLALRKQDSALEADERKNIGEAVKLLCNELDDFAQAVEKSGKWPSVTKRTEKAFRVMRKSGKKARRTQANADFHAWRKKTKRLLYLLEMRNGDATHREKELLERVYKLQATLGDDHDCVIAAQQLPVPKKSHGVTRAVTKLLGERQRRLRKKSGKIARRIDAVA